MLTSPKKYNHWTNLKVFFFTMVTFCDHLHNTLGHLLRLCAISTIPTLKKTFWISLKAKQPPHIWRVHTAYAATLPFFFGTVFKTGTTSHLTLPPASPPSLSLLLCRVISHLTCRLSFSLLLKLKVVSSVPRDSQRRSAKLQADCWAAGSEGP